MEKLRSISFYNFPKTRTAYYPMTPLSPFHKPLLKSSSHHFTLKELFHSYKHHNIHNLTPNKSIQSIINSFTMELDNNNIKRKRAFHNSIDYMNNKQHHNNSVYCKYISLLNRKPFQSFNTNKHSITFKKQTQSFSMKIKNFSYFNKRELYKHKKQNLLIKTKQLNDLLPFHLQKPENPQFLNKKHYYINSKLNIKSTLLGKLSIFILVSSQGEFSENISSLIFNYMTEYLTTSTDIPVCQKRDNYYTIITNVFTSTSRYIQHHSLFNTDKTGASCLLLLIPHSIRNRIFCANVGDSRCVLFGYSNPFPLSYQHVPLLQTEKERIECSEKGMIVNGKVCCKGEEEGFKLNVSRGFGWFSFDKCGVICEPEIVECDIYKERGKCIVIGNNTFWEWLTLDEVNGIVRKCYANYDANGAGKGFIEKITEKHLKKEKIKRIEEVIGVVILFK